jgi:hypothetical protein
MIDVSCTSTDDPLEFDVTVGEGADKSRHHVTMDKAAYDKLGGGHDPERVIAAAFAFLLDREPRESILPRFDVTVISRYFPEFETELPGYLEKT